MPIKKKIIPYNPELKDLAKELRRKMTFSEVLLWNEVKNKQILGYDFDRQRPIDNFIVDFYCKELSLAIEIDGDTHIYRYDYDDERQRVLEELGVHFLRFDDIEVKKNMINVLRVIEDWIKRYEEHISRPLEPTPNPSREGNQIKEPTPSPSREGNRREKDSSSNTEPTPNPSREGNQEIDPSRERNLYENLSKS